MKKTNTNKAYSLTLQMNGLKYSGEGDTFQEAFDALGLTFQQVKTKGEITVKKGDKVAHRLFQMPKLRRYFLSKVLRSGLIRDFEKLLA
jgi:hypothetical protein